MQGTLPQRLATTAFMALVTVWLIALVLAKAGAGAAGMVEVVVYALTAGFGLEFLISCWPRVWPGPPPGSSRRSERGQGA